MPLSHPYKMEGVNFLIFEVVGAFMLLFVCLYVCFQLLLKIIQAAIDIPHYVEPNHTFLHEHISIKLILGHGQVLIIECSACIFRGAWLSA